MLAFITIRFFDIKLRNFDKHVAVCIGFFNHFPVDWHAVEIVRYHGAANASCRNLPDCIIRARECWAAGFIPFIPLFQFVISVAASNV